MKFLPFLTVCLLATTAVAAENMVVAQSAAFDSATMLENAKKLHSFGNPESPVKVFLFTSFSCPHCVNYHNQMLNNLLTKYVDTKKVNFTFVEMSSEPKGVTVSMIARCLPNDKYIAFLQTMYAEKNNWNSSTTPRRAIMEYASRFGMDKADFDACLTSKELNQTMYEQRKNLASLYKVRAFPSTVIVKDGNSQLITGANESKIMESLDTLLAQ